MHWDEIIISANMLAPIEPYDYYEWHGLGPLAGVLDKGVSLFLSTKWTLPLIFLLIIGAFAFAYFVWRLPKEKRWYIAMVLPIFIFDAIYSLRLIWVLPHYLLCLALLEKQPKVSGVLAAIGTLLGLHPLLSLFLIFFTKKRRAFGMGAIVGGVIGLLAPLFVYDPMLYLRSMGAWYMSFRAKMTPLADGVMSDYSAIGLLRHLTTLHERWIWLILVNLFHLLLLPTLRIGRSRQPSRMAPLFVGSVLTFIGLMSGLNSPFTIVLPLSGILLWALYSKLYPGWLLFSCMMIASVVSYGISLYVWIEPLHFQQHLVDLCEMTMICFIPMHVLQIIELWSSPRNRK